MQVRAEEAEKNQGYPIRQVDLSVLGDVSARYVAVRSSSTIFSSISPGIDARLHHCVDREQH